MADENYEPPGSMKRGVSGFSPRMKLRSRQNKEETEPESMMHPAFEMNNDLKAVADEEIKALGCDPADYESLEEKQNFLKAIKDSTASTNNWEAHANELIKKVEERVEQPRMEETREKFKKDDLVDKKLGSRKPDVFERDAHRKLLETKISKFESYQNTDKDLKFDKYEDQSTRVEWFYDESSGLHPPEHFDAVSKEFENLSLLAKRQEGYDGTHGVNFKEDEMFCQATNVSYRDVVAFEEQAKKGQQRASRYTQPFQSFLSNVVEQFTSRGSSSSFSNVTNRSAVLEDEEDDVFLDDNFNLQSKSSRLKGKRGTGVKNSAKGGQGRGRLSNSNAGPSGTPGTSSRPNILGGKKSGTAKRDQVEEDEISCPICKTKLAASEVEKHVDECPNANKDESSNDDQQMDTGENNLESCEYCGLAIPKEVLISTHLEICRKKNSGTVLSKEGIASVLSAEWSEDDEGDEVASVCQEKGIKIEKLQKKKGSDSGAGGSKESSPPNKKSKSAKAE